MASAATSRGSPSEQDMAQQPSLSLFEAVTNKDYDTVAELYADNARRTIVSFLAMRNRWSPFVGIEKSEEKCNDFLQQIACQESKLGYISAEQSPPVHSFSTDDVQYHTILNELGVFLTESTASTAGDDSGDEGYQDMDCDFPPCQKPSSSSSRQPSWKSTSTPATASVSWSSFASISTSSTSSLSSSASRVFSRSNSTSTTGSNEGGSEGVNRLLWDSAAIYSDSRPPSNFVVYNANGDNTRIGGEGPPLFDGSVANSTPPPLGGISAGPSGGSGTILHLACALDAPLALALILAMGADARSTHTAFRRLMIHEAACNGSIQCLTLLLELGQACAQNDEEDTKMPTKRLPDSARHSASQELRFMENSASTFSEYQRRRSKEVRSRGLFGTDSASFGGTARSSSSSPTASPSERGERPRGDFVQFLRVFREYTTMVRNGFMTELDAARSILSQASLAEPSRVSLAHSCTFQKGFFALSRGIFRPRGGGCADGHGNTPLHWAAFKNEVKCVSLLLAFNADPNARAHPSGWTPLHDAAYSNSKESIALLVAAGAHVDARANSGATPLCFAAQEDAADAARLLLQRGADLATRCSGGPYVRGDDDNNANNHPHPHSRFSGYTPLHYCAHYNAHSAARVLLADSAAKRAMEIADLSERLPIHVAVARGSSDVLRELLHAGARVETPQSRQRAASRRPDPVGDRHASSPTPLARNQQPTGSVLSTPTRAISIGSDTSVSTPVSSPVLRAMIPAQPITSSKPWNCLSQRSIDECRNLISHAERNWTPERHLLFTPADRRAVMELLRVGKRLELQGTGIFIDLWPLVLSFCGRGWFEIESAEGTEKVDDKDMPMCSVARLTYEGSGDEDLLMLPSLSR